MARRSAKAAGGTTPLPPADEASARTPPPPDELHVTLTALAQGAVLHRVHQSKYAADRFNPGVQGNARFSPIFWMHRATRFPPCTAARRWPAP